MSGFREGWAVKVMDGLAHYFRRKGAGLARSLCGAQDAPAGWLNAVGHSNCCERCAKLRDRELEKQAEETTELGRGERDDLGTKDGGDCA